MIAFFLKDDDGISNHRLMNKMNTWEGSSVVSSDPSSHWIDCQFATNQPFLPSTSCEYGYPTPIVLGKTASENEDLPAF